MVLRETIGTVVNDASTLLAVNYSYNEMTKKPRRQKKIVNVVTVTRRPVVKLINEGARRRSQSSGQTEKRPIKRESLPCEDNKPQLLLLPVLIPTILRLSLAGSANERHSHKLLPRCSFIYPPLTERQTRRISVFRSSYCFRGSQGVSSCLSHVRRNIDQLGCK